MKNVGVVDSEYIVHLGLPTLGGPNGNEASDFISTCGLTRCNSPQFLPCLNLNKQGFVVLVCNNHFF